MIRLTLAADCSGDHGRVLAPVGHWSVFDCGLHRLRGDHDRIVCSSHCAAIGLMPMTSCRRSPSRRGRAICRPTREDTRPDDALLPVADTRKALGHLATYVRQQLNGRVIAIGGSNGKTTTKHLVGSVLSRPEGHAVAQELQQRHRRAADNPRRAHRR